MFTKRLQIAIVVLLACVACQSKPVTRTIDPGEKLIEVEGVVQIYPGGHGLGLVKLDDGKCYDLALPREVLKNSHRWQQHRVSISGVLTYRPLIEDAMWIEIKDRKVEGFGCSEDLIYVDTIKKA